MNTHGRIGSTLQDMDALRRTFHRLLLFEGSYTNKKAVQLGIIAAHVRQALHEAEEMEFRRA